MCFSKFRKLNFNSLEEVCNALCENKKDHTLDIIKTSKLYASDLSGLNDVQEYLYLYQTSENLNKDDLKNKLENIFFQKKQKRICCFSQKYHQDDFNQNLMWSHYANSHKGLRIDFDFNIENERLVKKVKYQKPKVIKKLDDIIDNQELLEEIMISKLPCWKYEQESRVIIDDEFVQVNIRRIVIGRGFFNGLETLEDNIHVFKALAKEISKYLHNIEICAYEGRYSNILKNIK